MKPITIDALVRWAAVDEWPKVKPDDWSPTRPIGSGWGSVLTYAQLLTVIDTNRLGVLPDLRMEENPARDATTLAAAMAEIEGSPLGPIEPEWLIGDWITSQDLVGPLVRKAVTAIEEETIVDRSGDRHPRGRLGEMVVRRAILGAPDCDLGEAVRLVPRKHATGADMWVRQMRRPRIVDADGNALAWDMVEVPVTGCKGRRPMDAYRAMMLSPERSIEACLRRRVRHVVWRAALRAIGAALVDRLVDHVVIDDGVSGMPWLGLGRPRGRVLAAVDGHSRSEATKKKKRRNA